MVPWLAREFGVTASPLLFHLPVLFCTFCHFADQVHLLGRDRVKKHLSLKGMVRSGANGVGYRALGTISTALSAPPKLPALKPSPVPFRSHFV